MTGLDGDATLPDYIPGITERIWEGRGIDLIRRWHAPDCVMHTPAGPVHGAFGPPSGAEVLAMGITHAEFAGPRVARAFRLADELSLHRMIGAQLG